MHDYTQLAFAGEVEKARAVRDSLEPVREAMRRTRPGGKPQAQQKYWQELLGQTGGPVRRPMLPLTDAEKAAIREAFDSCGLVMGDAQAAQ
jgi:4-hydroxy-tetrahydrodipicolinate synthase